MSKSKAHSKRANPERVYEHLIELYIPTRVPQAESGVEHIQTPKGLIPFEQWYREAEDKMGRLFGGATTLRALSGVYRSDKEVEIVAGKSVPKLLEDPEPWIVWSYVSSEDFNSENIKTIREFMIKKGIECNQEAVALVIDQEFHVIPIPRNVPDSPRQYWGETDGGKLPE